MAGIHNNNQSTTADPFHTHTGSHPSYFIHFPTFPGRYEELGGFVDGVWMCGEGGRGAKAKRSAIIQ